MRVRFLMLLLCGLILMEIAVSGQSVPESEITLPRYSGYITVAPNSRYFVDEQGQGFLVIGQNDAVPWPGLSTLLDRRAPEATEAYIQDLRAHGITVSRVMMEYSQEPHTYLENPVGTFSDTMVQFWDDFIALAEKHGLYLLLTPYDTFWQNTNWEGYPYHVNRGGACETKRDWLTNRACIEAQKNRWRFIIERWGGSPNIFAWDLMNEIDIWWDATPAEIDAYLTEMAAFVRDLEMQHWGRTHLLTASSAAPVPDGQLGEAIYNHPALDFANTHLYIGNDINDPENPIGAGPTMAGGVILSLQAMQSPRPYFDSESGPISDWIERAEFDKEYHHNMSWAHLAAGGAGSGMRWPYTDPHWILPELRDNLLGLARFAATIDWANFNSRNINSDLKMSDRAILDVGISDGQTAVIWLLLDTRRDPALTFADASLTVSEVLAQGEYQVEFWETYAGNRLDTVTVNVNANELVIPLPAFEQPLKDLAILIRPVTAGASQ